MNSLDFLSHYDDLRIAYGILNWGLGHASRSVPIIEKLNQNNEVVLFSDGLSAEWLKRNCSNNKIVDLPGYNMTYKHRWMWMNVARGSVDLMNAVNREYTVLEKEHKKKSFDMVISDHRLGFRNDNIRSILLAHQINIPHSQPLLATMASNFQITYMEDFDEVWIPDYEDERLSLSGKLSRNKSLKNCRFIGPLSRFTTREKQKTEFELAAILSGPEPARSKLESKLLKILGEVDRPSCLIRGTSKNTLDSVSHEKIKIFDLCNSQSLREIIESSKVVICRAGYSSIMDMVATQTPAILIPTHNQPEQEYLASRMHDRYQFKSISEENLNTRQILKLINDFGEH